MVAKRYPAEQVSEHEKSFLQQRKHERFRPAPNTMALIDIYSGDNDFFPYVKGLVTEESCNGVRVVVTNNEYWVENAQIKIKKDGEEPISAKIRWLRQIDFNTIVMGLEFISNPS